MYRVKLPPTAKRVRLNSNTEINEHIDEQTNHRIKRYVGISKSELTDRIQELEREWDTERILEANFASVVMLSTLLGYTINKKWLALSGGAAFFLLQHALQGWCPPLSIIRRLGIRTASEINEETNALKVMRGDYDHLLQLNKEFDTE
jgi:hypothetical protein